MIHLSSFFVAKIYSFHPLCPSFRSNQDANRKGNRKRKKKNFSIFAIKKWHIPYEWHLFHFSLVCVTYLEKNWSARHTHTHTRIMIFSRMTMLNRLSTWIFFLLLISNSPAINGKITDNLLLLFDVSFVKCTWLSLFFFLYLASSSWWCIHVKYDRYNLLKSLSIFFIL